jgi:hypothetical protein
MLASCEVAELEGNAFAPLTGEAQRGWEHAEATAHDQAGGGEMLVSDALAEVAQEADPLVATRPRIADLALHSLLASAQPPEAALAAFGRTGQRFLSRSARE